MSAPDAAALQGERKPVTALFADLVGSTSLAESLDPEDWAVVVNRIYEVTAAAIRRYDGTITQLSGDAIVAIFGAPVAHEDDPERAVRAAFDLLAAVTELSAEVRDDLGTDLLMRVGVNTGLAVVGAVGSEGHEEYTALGDAMNVAARIQGAAQPGSVLVTEATYEQVRELVDATALGALEVKGKAEPVQAYEVTTVHGRAGRTRGVPGLESPLVGRAGQLEQLDQLVEVVRAGRGRAALVLGEPGIGKSRLLAELRRRGDGTAWIEGRCLSYGRSLPHHLLVDLVASMAESDGEPDAAAIEALASRLLGQGASEATTHLLHLVGLPTPPEVTERLAALDPTAVRRRYVDALNAVVGAMAGDNPLVLVCEDLHWADAASIDVLSELARIVHRAPVLLLATSRPERESEGWRFVSYARSALGDALAELRLEPLSLDDSRALVANLLEIESLPSHVRELILERTDGNPFFVEEVIRTLIDDGLIARRGDRWVASDDLASVHVPETVQGLLLGRIDRLPDGARRAARVASVLGRSFTPALLEAVIEEPLDVQTEIGTLEAHGLVNIAATSPEVTFGFRHALVQEAAYEGLLRRERQELHGRVADVLEERHTDHPEEIAALLAHHLDLAGEVDRAVPYLLEAGRQALTRYAHREAHALFARAAELLVDRTEADSRRHLLEALVGKAEAGRSFIPAGGEELELLEKVLPEAETLGDERLLARVHLGIAEHYYYLGQETPQLEASMDRARELGERLGDDLFTALPLSARGDMAFNAGEYRKAIADYGVAAEIFQRREHYSPAAISAGGVAMAEARLGEFDRADEWIDRAGVLAEKSGDPNAVLDVDIFRGVVEAERGRLDVAVTHSRLGLEQAREVGNLECALVGAFNLGDQYLQMNDPQSAIAMFEESNEIAAYCNIGPLTAMNRAWLATARMLAGGKVDEQLDEVETALQAARAYGRAHGEAEIHRHRATILAAQPDPDWDAVFADLEAAIAIFERLEARPALARTLHGYGTALEAAGRTDEAAATRERASQLSREMGVALAS